jgi:hypothetical protein
VKLVSTICDVHAATDKHPGVERNIIIDGSPFTLDVCDGFVSELRSRSTTNRLEAGLTAPNGKAPKKKTAAPIPVAPPAMEDASGLKASDEDFPCFACPQVLKQTGFQSHAKVHGFSTARGMVGENCPLCNDKHGRLTNHAKEKHGIANVALLFQTALRDGDKFGIVGKRIKAAKNVRLT